MSARFDWCVARQHHKCIKSFVSMAHGQKVSCSCACHRESK